MDFELKEISIKTMENLYTKCYPHLFSRSDWTPKFYSLWNYGKIRLLSIVNLQAKIWSSQNCIDNYMMPFRFIIYLPPQKKIKFKSTYSLCWNLQTNLMIKIWGVKKVMYDTCIYPRNLDWYSIFIKWKHIYMYIFCILNK